MRNESVRLVRNGGCSDSVRDSCFPYGREVGLSEKLLYLINRIIRIKYGSTHFTTMRLLEPWSWRDRLAEFLPLLERTWLDGQNPHGGSQDDDTHFRRSNAFLWPPWALHAYGVHTYIYPSIQNTYRQAKNP